MNIGQKSLRPSVDFVFLTPTVGPTLYPSLMHVGMMHAHILMHVARPSEFCQSSKIFHWKLKWQFICGQKLESKKWMWLKSISVFLIIRKEPPVLAAEILRSNIVRRNTWKDHINPPPPYACAPGINISNPTAFQTLLWQQWNNLFIVIDKLSNWRAYENTLMWSFVALNSHSW